MSTALVSDALWAIVARILPPEQPKPKGGRQRIADRAALTGIVFVALCCALACWRRLQAAAA